MEAHNLTEADLRTALESVLPHYGRYDMVPEDHARVVDDRTVMAEASLDLAMSFSQALSEALPEAYYVEAGGMGKFNVVEA
ncbi:hypothetical protein M197_gp61 [Haloarcula hispanica tailed virus 2]|uniref:Uncharacterized protein n=1 Tax=Haloarcula hispanica tailed virus 2 TaxID=1273751 RepID=R4TG70_9CAUD|nr:hypothetical protein M197_gp61 [Haloarcula hispanica tailed virus 2]AGM11226.1 hypothetical protein HHTV2_61 [Haloarcula hispanica tailed virus 2]